MDINCRRNLRREAINGIGCMWVFINLFGSIKNRLLIDKKRRGIRVAGYEMKQLTCSIESVGEKIIDISIADDEHVETGVCKSLDDDYEEKFKEIIKRLIAQKEGEIQTSKDLLEAFHGLGSEEDSFLKKVSHEDASSLVDIKKVVQEEKPEVISKQEEVVIPKKKSNFFSRKWKSEERRNRSQVRKTVVVLKPGPNNLDVDSSSGPHYTGNKSKTRRNFSRFFIRLIKRRLQSAVGKKPCAVLVDKSQEIQCNTEKHVLDEEKPFCNEGNSEADKGDTDNTSEESKKTMSGLYIAAKKHLSEMLANGDINVNLPDKEVPKILGKILSLPEFCSPAENPRLIPSHDLVSNISPLSQKIEEPKILQCTPTTYNLIDDDSDKDEDTLFTINVSVPKDYGKETENIEKEEKSETNPLSEICSSSVSAQVECLDENVSEFCEEDRDKQSPQKDMFNQQSSQFFPPESPPSSSIRLTECRETKTDAQGKLSPVSVLEPQFTDDDSSPTASTRFSSAEMRMQPLSIRFDEADSPKPGRDNNVKTSTDEKELTLAYIEVVVKSSGLSWEELLTRPFYSKQLLELELTDDVVFCPTQLCDDKNLLDDCINEVLLDFCWNEFNPGPWISFLKPEVQLISDMEIAAKVAQEGVNWHLLPLPSPHTLDQIVIKDMARTGSWMDLRFEIGCLGSYTGEMILDELVEEIIMSYKDLVQAEPMQDPNSNLL